MASEESAIVQLYVYDLTHGLASLLAPSIIGKPVEGVWHTSVVAYDREFFYGGGGITSCAPGSTQLGPPHRVERLGETFVPFELFVEYVRGLAASTFTAAAYDLLEHNCNHFSDEAARFLCGARLPKDVLRQPDELLAPPHRAALRALLDNLAPPAAQTMYANGGSMRHREDSPEFETLNSQIEEARVQSQQLEQRRSTLAEKLARKERRREKKRSKMMKGCDAHRDIGEGDNDMAEAVETASGGVEELSRAGPSSAQAAASAASAASAATAALLEADADERRAEELRRRSRDPPIVFADLDGTQEFEKLAKALESAELSAEQQQNLDELQQYLVQGEGSWVLGDDFLANVGQLLGREQAAPSLLRALAAAALREDLALVLHQDRRHHALMNHAHAIDALALDQQRALALFMCNLFENLASSEWLLYISEWEHNGQALSNIRATTKVCVHCALSSDPELRDVGTALMYNVATKERFQAGRALRLLLPKHAKSKVFDEVCVELAMALLQLLQWAPAEEHLFRACAALARFASHSHDVPQLIAMVGPDPSAYRGTSPRVDEQIDLIMKKVKM